MTLPWALEIAHRGIENAAKDLRPVARAINLAAGEVTNKPVAETFGYNYSHVTKWRRGGEENRHCRLLVCRVICL